MRREAVRQRGRAACGGFRARRADRVHDVDADTDDAEISEHKEEHKAKVSRGERRSARKQEREGTRTGLGEDCRELRERRRGVEAAGARTRAQRGCGCGTASLCGRESARWGLGGG